MEYDLGFFDQDEGHVQPAPNPFVPKVVPAPNLRLGRLLYEVSPMCPGSTKSCWWRRRELNPRPLALGNRLYMLRVRLLI